MMSDWQTEPKEINKYITREDEHDDESAGEAHGAVYPHYVLYDTYKRTVYHRPKWVYSKFIMRDVVRAACGIPDIDNNLDLRQNTPQNILGRRPCKKCFHL